MYMCIEKHQPAITWSYRGKHTPRKLSLICWNTKILHYLILHYIRYSVDSQLWILVSRPSYDYSSMPAFMCCRFPRTVLVHGTDDYVVPLSSTANFDEQLQRLNVASTVRLIPSCDHYEIIMDLMRTDRKFHNSVMGVIEDTGKEVFSWCTGDT